MTLDPVLTAISSGDVDRLAQLVSGGADVKSTRSVPHPRLVSATTDMTPLGWAAYVSSKYDEARCRQIISTLLSGGADSRAGKAVLYATTPWSVEELSNAGASINVAMSDGSQGEIGATALMFRAEEHDLATVEMLVALGADSSIQNATEETALDYGIKGNSIVRTSSDVEKRIDIINAIAISSLPIDSFSRAMLSIASVEFAEGSARASLTPLLELLEQFGGSPVDVKDSSRQRLNILMSMLQRRSYRSEPFDEFSWLCRRYGYSLLEDADDTGAPPLFYIFRGFQDVPHFVVDKMPELLRLFLAYGADPNFRDNKGRTPLHEVVRRACGFKGTTSVVPTPCIGPNTTTCAKFRESVQILLDHGADRNLADFRGKTAGGYAKERPKCPFGSLGAVPSTSKYFLDTERSGTSAREDDSIDIQKELSIDVLWMLQSSEAFVDTSAVAESPVSEDPGSGKDALEDPSASRLAEGVYKLYKKANQKYVGMDGHVYKYITINPGNGLRSSALQAQYYERYIYYKYYGGPGPYPRANRPGKSKHEYGYAIDVVRSGDESRLSKALCDAGWRPTVEDEGWHWEAVGAPRYSELAKFIKNEMEALSRDWADKLSSFYEIRKISLTLLDELEEIRVNIATKRRIFDELQRELSRKSQWIREEENRLRLVQNELNSLDQQISEMQRRLGSMSYTYCPRGFSYWDCNHERLKQKYDNERRQLEQEIRSKRARKMKMAEVYSRDAQNLAEARRQQAQDERNFRSKRRELDELRRSEAMKKREVLSRQGQMKAFRQEATSLLSRISDHVSRWK